MPIHRLALCHSVIALRIAPWRSPPANMSTIGQQVTIVERMAVRLIDLAPSWRSSSLGSESTLHQLAPYIGKLKSSLAAALIESHSQRRDIIIDPFSGSGVVPLEALLRHRSVIAGDINPYAAVLTQAKMFPVADVWTAIGSATEYLTHAKMLARKKYYRVAAPGWVRRFFHPRTLAEVKTLSDLLRKNKEWFLLANLLGILHHQRPGFLSYPSSHLVPYLRTKKFPRSRFPAMYRYRDMEPRLIAKLLRTYKRFAPIETLHRSFRHGDINKLSLRSKAEVAITSPPYMNALDYGRDNRLRLWFVGMRAHKELDDALPTNKESFTDLMRVTARKLRTHLKPRGKAILIVGEVRRSQQHLRTNEIVRSVFEDSVGGWRLIDEITDTVPDIRRSRRSYRGTKKEWVMVFRKTC
jgi:hypothetical protein